MADTTFVVHTKLPTKRTKSPAISQEKWHSLKSIIEQKYVLEDMTLSELNTYMEEHHSFFAT